MTRTVSKSEWKSLQRKRGVSPARTELPAALCDPTPEFCSGCGDPMLVKHGGVTVTTKGEGTKRYHSWRCMDE
jgi:hypothetical protein